MRFAQLLFFTAGMFFSCYGQRITLERPPENKSARPLDCLKKETLALGKEEHYCLPRPSVDSTFTLFTATVNDENVRFIRFDASGTILDSVPVSFDYHLFDYVETSDAFYVLLSNYTGNELKPVSKLCRYDKKWKLQWEVSVGKGFNYSETGRHLFHTSGGELLIVAGQLIAATSRHGRDKFPGISSSRYTTSGKLIERQYYKGTAFEFPASGTAFPDGSFLITADGTEDNGRFYTRLLKIDAEGKVLLNKKKYDTECRGVLCLRNGGIVLYDESRSTLLLVDSTGRETGRTVLTEDHPKPAGFIELESGNLLVSMISVSGLANETIRLIVLSPQGKRLDEWVESWFSLSREPPLFLRSDGELLILSRKYFLHTAEYYSIAYVMHFRCKW